MFQHIRFSIVDIIALITVTGSIVSIIGSFPWDSMDLIYKWNCWLFQDFSLYCLGAFLVSNSQQHKQDHERQHFWASEKLSFFQITVQGNKKTAYKLFGVNMTPEMIVIALVYFIQDIIGLSELAISFFLKDDLHLDPAEVSDVWIEHSLFFHNVFEPWAVNLSSEWSSAHSSFLHRRSYMVIVNSFPEVSCSAQQSNRTEHLA